MNIQKSFDAIIEKYGHDVIYIRRDTQFQCDCYLERNGEAEDNCKKCFGLGNPVTLEKIRVRYKTETPAETKLQLHSNEGTVVPVEYEYFVKKEDAPKNGDLIYEVEFDEAGKAVQVLEKSFISLARPLRGTNGRIEFYQVYARNQRKDRKDDKTVAERYIQTNESCL